MRKNWSSDSRDGCKPPSNLVELGFEEELEDSFERDEIMDILNVEFFFENFHFL